MITTIQNLVEQSSQFSVWIALGAVWLASMFPFLPLPVLYGIVGYSFPVAVALVLNICGSLLGTLSFFLLIRYLFPGKALAYLKNNYRAKKLFEHMEARGFQMVLIARMIPIVPSMAVNIVSAISPVSAVTFLTATVLGKLPLITIYTVAGGQVDLYTSETLLILFCYTALLLVAAHLIRKKWA